MQDTTQVDPTDDRVAARLVHIISDGFNRSLRALREAGAVDCTEMQRAYAGAGSKYYDLVTQQIESTARLAAPGLRKQLGFESPHADHATPGEGASA